MNKEYFLKLFSERRKEITWLQKKYNNQESPGKRNDGRDEEKRRKKTKRERREQDRLGY